MVVVYSLIFEKVIESHQLWIGLAALNVVPLPIFINGSKIKASIKVYLFTRALI